MHSITEAVLHKNVKQVASQFQMEVIVLSYSDQQKVDADSKTSM